jgi:hypothetical protein
MVLPGQTRQAAAVMLLDAIKSMPSQQLCNVLYTAIADKSDIKSQDLEDLSNKLGRVAWERARYERGESRHGEKSY